MEVSKSIWLIGARQSHITAHHTEPNRTASQQTTLTHRCSEWNAKILYVDQTVHWFLVAFLINRNRIPIEHSTNARVHWMCVHVRMSVNECEMWIVIVAVCGVCSFGNANKRKRKRKLQHLTIWMNSIGFQTYNFAHSIEKYFRSIGLFVLAFVMPINRVVKRFAVPFQRHEIFCPLRICFHSRFYDTNPAQGDEWKSFEFLIISLFLMKWIV